MKDAKRVREVEDGSTIYEKRARTSAFTKGWDKSLQVRESLPIKRGGKVIKQLRAIHQSQDDVEDEETSEPEQSSSRKTHKSKGSSSVTQNDDDDDNDEYNNDEGPVENVKIVAKSKMAKNSVIAFLQKQPDHILMARVADICTAIMENPARSLQREREDSSDTNPGEVQYRMQDLFDILTTPLSRKITEMAMLSCMLVFKDICPGYRIRPPEETDTTVQLKKETKQMQSFEFALLRAYKRYLGYLDEKINSGLGNARKPISDMDDDDALFGLSALRCQCELLNHLPYFNFRSSILTSIVSRAAQPTPLIYNVCCETLCQLFKNDVEGEASLDAINLIAKVLDVSKYNVPWAFLQTLTNVKLKVHAKDSKKIHAIAKRERRNRKRATDDVAVGLLEASAVTEKNIAQKFQSDALQEVCLIYFRIIKMKVGFTLLPCALEGLSRITHLLNIDTVEDLIVLMRSVIESQPPAPAEIRLQCLLCALKTLSGPGNELGIDRVFFTDRLKELMIELPSGFDRWDSVLECIELCLLSRREEHSTLTVTIIRILFLCTSHMASTMGGISVLCMIHMILLRYPRTRAALITMSTVHQRLLVDEQTSNLAMDALRSDVSDVHSTDDEGGWLLPLLRKTVDPQYTTIVTAITSNDVVPISMRTDDAKCDDNIVIRRVDRALSFTFDHRKQDKPVSGRVNGVKKVAVKSVIKQPSQAPKGQHPRKQQQQQKNKQQQQQSAKKPFQKKQQHTNKR